jgi:transposase-like protein
MIDHTPEFLEQAVKQTLTGDESIKDIAAGLGVSYQIPLEALEYLSASSGFNEEITMPVPAAM